MASAATWSWFRGYCVAARVLAWLQQRSPLATTSLPASFRDEVHRRIQELSGDDERSDRRHEDCELFHQEQDEELILWLNRLTTVKFLSSEFGRKGKRGDYWFRKLGAPRNTDGEDMLK